MEGRFREDFSHVRIHNDGAAARSAADVNARAYTVGSHIVFGERSSSSNRALLAHELAHVVQHDHGSSAANVIRRTPDDGGKGPPEIPSKQPGYLPNDQLIARSKEIAQNVARKVLEKRGKIPDDKLVRLVSSNFTVGVLQGHKDGKVVTLVAVNNPKFVELVREELGKSEVFVEPIAAQKENARTGELNKSRPATVDAEQVLAAEAYDQKLVAPRVATSNLGCQELCVSNLKENYPKVQHVNPAPVKPPSGGKGGGSGGGGSSSKKATKPAPAKKAEDAAPAKKPPPKSTTKSDEAPAKAPAPRLPKAPPKAKDADSPSTAKKPAKTKSTTKTPQGPVMVEEPGSEHSATSVTAHAANSAINQALGDVSSKLMSMASEKGMDPELAQALNTFSKIMEFKAIATDPNALATKLGDIAIDYALSSLGNSLRSQMDEFRIKFPDVDALRRKYSVADLRSAYASAAAVFRRQEKIKALWATFLAVSVPGQKQLDWALENELPKLVAQTPSAKPDFEHYQTVRGTYGLHLMLMSMTLDGVTEEMNKLPPDAADQVFKRAEVLDRLSGVFSHYADQLKPFVGLPIVGNIIQGSVGYFEHVADGIAGFAGQMRLFGYEMGARKAMYSNERMRLDIEMEKLKEHSRNPFAPFRP